MDVCFDTVLFSSGEMLLSDQNAKRNMQQEYDLRWVHEGGVLEEHGEHAAVR